MRIAAGLNNLTSSVQSTKVHEQELIRYNENTKKKVYQFTMLPRSCFASRSLTLSLSLAVCNSASLSASYIMYVLHILPCVYRAC